jgi:hypothetical protein
MEELNIIDCPMVSVIVPNWNGKIVIRDCLTSLQRLTYPNYEVIVVDNGSTDGSAKMIREEFPTTKMVISPLNLGFAGACNLGIKIAKGQLVALFNNDAIAHPSWLSELVKTIMQSSRISIASGVILRGKPSDILLEAGKRMDVFTGATWRIGYGSKLSKLGKVHNIDYFSLCAALIRKELVKEIGLIDEGYFVYFEDADWAFSARRKGYECILVPSAVVWHEGSVSTKNMPSKRFYWEKLNHFRLIFKQFPLRYLFSALIFQLIFVSFLQVVFFGYPVTYMALKLKAFILNIVNLPKTMVERKRVECLGELDLKPRLRELTRIVMAREKGREF